MNREINDIIKECYKREYIVKKNGGGHYRVHLPNHKVITISSTPSGTMAHKQVLRDFKRAGIII